MVSCSSAPTFARNVKEHARGRGAQVWRSANSFPDSAGLLRSDDARSRGSKTSSATAAPVARKTALGRTGMSISYVKPESSDLQNVPDLADSQDKTEGSSRRSESFSEDSKGSALSFIAKKGWSMASVVLRELFPEHSNTATSNISEFHWTTSKVSDLDGLWIRRAEYSDEEVNAFEKWTERITISGTNAVLGDGSHVSIDTVGDRSYLKGGFLVRVGDTLTRFQRSASETRLVYELA